MLMIGITGVTGKLGSYVAERIWHGQETKRALLLEKRRWPFTTGISLPYCRHHSTPLERIAYDYHSRWKLPLHR